MTPLFKNILKVGAFAGAAFVGTQVVTNNEQNESTMQNSTYEMESNAQSNGSGVTVSDVNFLMEPGTGYLRVFGIIHNNTDKWVMAECHITSFDASGRPIDVDGWKAEHEKEVHPQGDDAAESVESVYTPSIPPHSKVCVNHLRDGKKLKAAPASVKIKLADISESGAGVSFSKPDFTSTPRIETQKIYDGTTKTYDRGFILKGAVTNIGKTTSTRSRLAIIWYDKAGKIIEIQEVSISDGIPSGKNIQDPSSFLLSSHQKGDIMPGERREFSGSVNWPKALESTKNLGKMELMAYDETWVD
jgi:hypothetical protein